MSRRVLTRLHAHFLGRRPAARSLWLAGLSLAGLSLVVTAALIAAIVALRPHPLPPLPVRTAIRVHCSALTCPLVESLAIDVWSEQRGPGLPLDIVVTDDTLPRLDAAAIAWQILVPDIDEAARAEAARLRNPPPPARPTGSASTTTTTTSPPTCASWSSSPPISPPSTSWAPRSKAAPSGRCASATPPAPPPPPPRRS
jgi:hypothetical protein